MGLHVAAQLFNAPPCRENDAIWHRARGRRRARREERPLGWADIDRALRAGREDMPQETRWRIAIHDMPWATWPLDRGRISLISVEAVHGGVVRVEAEAHALETEDWMMAAITGRLAGRAAEELVFGDPLAGCG